MKSEIRVRQHEVYPSQSVVEVWFNGEFIATVTGADGPGVRVISKHPLSVASPVESHPLNVATVSVQPR